MTWNPVVHMGHASLVMFALWGIAWGAMPINPSRFRGRLDHAKVALAGPSMNLFLFAVALAVSAGVLSARKSLDEHTFQNLFLFFVTGAWLNMTLTLFNLLPVPPLDGWRIASDLWPAYAAIWRRGNSAALSLVIMVVLFLFVGPKVWDTAMDFTLAALRGVMRLLGKPLPAP
jgi:Zn-dependent protease